MSQPVDDDLFKDSTMSFGEHLEELRGALGRSLVGLIIGFLGGLFFADDAVKFVSSPLENALARLHVDMTTKEWTEKKSESLQPEDWLLLQEQQLVPTTIRMDVDQVIGQLASSGIIPESSSVSFEFDIRLDDVQEIAKSLVKTKPSFLNRSKFKKALWGSIPESSQQSLVALVEKDAIQDADRIEFTKILNALAGSKFYANEVFDDLGKLIEVPGKKRSFELLRQEAADNEQNVANPGAERLNRLLMSTVTDNPDLAPKKRAIDIRTWEPSDVRLQSLGAEEAFIILIKAALVLGLMFASPWIFYQIWNFVAAGLYPNEQKYVYTYLPFSLGLFFAGASLAFLFVFEPVLDFLFSFNVMMNISAAPRLNEWVSFVLFLPIGFGISFQLPLVMLLIERIGIITVKTFQESWRIAILVIFVISMLLTPADPMSMLLMGVPLTVLYFGGILLCIYMPGKSLAAMPEE